MSDKVIIEYIVGSFNSHCLAINDYRITDYKLYGRGTIVYRFEIDKDILISLFNDKSVCDMEIYSGDLFINGLSTQKKCTENSFNEYVEKIEKRRQRFSKDKKHNHNWNLCRRIKWQVSKCDVEHALNELL